MPSESSDCRSNAARMQSDVPTPPNRIKTRTSVCIEESPGQHQLFVNLFSQFSQVMPPRKKGAQVKNSTTGRGHRQGHGRGRGAAAQEAPEEPAPVVEDAPAPSESEAESIVPSPASQMDIVAEVHQAIRTVLLWQWWRASTQWGCQVPEEAQEVAGDGRLHRGTWAGDGWLPQGPEQAPPTTQKGLKDALWGAEGQGDGQDQCQLKKWYTNMRIKFGKLKPDSLRFWQNWTDYKGPLDPAPLRISEAPPHRPGQKEGHCQCKYFNFITIVHMFSHVFTVLMIVSSPDEGQGPSQGSSGCSSRSSPVWLWVWCRCSSSPCSRSVQVRGTDDTEATRSNIAELQRQLLNKLSKTEKSPLQRQKDTFADFMKEVTYTFPPPMWLRFQSEVNSLLQKYQFELHQAPPTQTQQQQQDEFHRPYPPAPIPGPISQQCPSMGWQPHPSQWPAQVHRPTSVWGSQEANWVQQQSQQPPPGRPQSAPLTYSVRTPLPQPSSTAIQNQDMGTSLDWVASALIPTTVSPRYPTPTRLMTTQNSTPLVQLCTLTHLSSSMSSQNRVMGARISYICICVTLRHYVDSVCTEQILCTWMCYVIVIVLVIFCMSCMYK